VHKLLRAKKEGEITKNYDSPVMVARSRIESRPPRADMNALINCFERLSNVPILVNDSHFLEGLNRKQTTFILAIII
jgi:hypothetical protein